MCKQRDQASLNEQINLDLTYSVSLNLCVQEVMCCVRMYRHCMLLEVLSNDRVHKRPGQILRKVFKEQEFSNSIK